MSLLRAYVPSDALVASAVPDVEVRPYSRVSEVLDADRIDVLVLPHPLTPDDRSAAAELRNTRVVQSLTSGVDHLEGVLLLASNVRLVGAPCLHAGPTAEQALTLIVSMLTLPLVLQSHFVVVLLSSLVVGFRARY
jgi:phosphoglycerate dehydrogenase-like enzyme